MIVDDHALIRQALKTVIDAEAGLVVVAEADSGRAAIDLFERNRPDVILMDGSMPEMNGIETTRRLKHLEPKVKIIGLTLYSQSTYLEEMVAVGASGYLVKTGSPENLINAIRVVDNGGTYLDPAVPRCAAAVAHKRSSTQKLTTDEMAVAKLLVNGQTNTEIADSLGLKIQVVETHRAAAVKNSVSTPVPSWSASPPSAIGSTPNVR